MKEGYEFNAVEMKWCLIEKGERKKIETENNNYRKLRVRKKKRE